MRHTKLAGIELSISPHKLRLFLFTWLKKKNIDDAFTQPYTGHVKRDSLEIYSKLSLAVGKDNTSASSFNVIKSGVWFPVSY